MSLSFKPVSAAFARRSAKVVARDLLGRLIVRTPNDSRPAERIVARIIETEAYLGAPDRASHAWNNRRTPRNASLYLPGGHWYVYFIYGMHFCVNLVAGEAETGGAALIRAAEIVEGADIAVRRRGLSAAPRSGDLAGGPGKLCKALAIDRAMDGLAVHDSRLWLAMGQRVKDADVATGPRIGVGYARQAATWPLRFAIAGHPEMSRPRL